MTKRLPIWLSEVETYILFNDHQFVRYDSGRDLDADLSLALMDLLEEFHADPE